MKNHQIWSIWLAGMPLAFAAGLKSPVRYPARIEAIVQVISRRTRCAHGGAEAFKISNLYPFIVLSSKLV
jgi:hypothetical protein